MTDLEKLRAFVAVAASGGCSRATRKIGISKSILSRRVAAVEASVGTRLFNRTTRGISLTEAGVDLYKRALQILAQLDEALDSIARRDNVVAGTLRLAAPLSFGIKHLASSLAEFATLHPHICLDVMYSDRFVDVVHEGFDAAVRIAELKDSSLVARRLAPVQTMIAASPSYFARHGVPQLPQDLANHEALIYTKTANADVWRFRTSARAISVRVRGPIRADNGEALRAAPVAGLGLCRLPNWLISAEIAKGSLVQALAGYTARGRDLCRPAARACHVGQGLRANRFLVAEFASNLRCE